MRRLLHRRWLDCGTGMHGDILRPAGKSPGSSPNTPNTVCVRVRRIPPAYTGSCIPRRTRRHQTIGPTCLARRVYIECISRCAEWANRDTVGVVRPVAAHVRRGIMVAWGQYRLCACTAVCSTGQGLVLSVFGGTAGVDWRRVRDSNPRGYYRAKGFTHWILDPAQ